LPYAVTPTFISAKFTIPTELSSGLVYEFCLWSPEATTSLGRVYFHLTEAATPTNVSPFPFTTLSYSGLPADEPACGMLNTPTQASSMSWPLTFSIDTGAAPPPLPVFTVPKGLVVYLFAVNQ
jgi:hypothetical protein